MNKKWMVTIGLLLLGSTLQAGDYSDTSFHDINDPVLKIILGSCSDINNYKLPQIEPSISTLSSRASQKRKVTDLDNSVVLPQTTLPSITTATLSTNTQLSKNNKKTLTCDYIVDLITGKTCGKIFKYPSILEKHTKGHTGEKPYQCTTCNDRFTQLSTLTRHKRVHTGKRPHECDYVDPITSQACKKKFTQLSNLKAHTRTHTKEKPYQCITCNKGFPRSNNLDGHRKTKRHLDAVAADSAALALAQGDNNE